MSKFSKEEKVEILSDIVGIKTVNDNEIEVAEYLQDLFKKHDIDTEIDKINDKRANLIATIGEGEPVVAISGHMDVVDPGDEDDWEHPPFELTEKDGYLYGRGSADMKSGLAALAIAMIEIKESDALEKGTIKFLATAGEEMEQTGSQQLYENGYMDDVDALIIAEPSETSLVYAHKGSMDFRITSKGLASHSSMPILGKNAIKPLIDFIQAIDKDYQEASKDIKFEKMDFSKLLDLAKEKGRDDIDDDVIESVVSGLVLNNTVIKGGNQVNSIPEVAEAEFNVRTVPEFDNDKVKELFQKHLDKVNDEGGDLKSEMFLDLDPVLTTGDNDLIKTGHDIASDMFDEEIIITPTVGVTDASNLLRGKDEDFSFLMLGPGSTPHQVDENVKKDTYLDFIDYYIKLLTTYINNQ
ncbi:succinyl-diaminopimelate desuccinylase [Staphylococcus auricularis]|uniref:Probable succinyl-diaminopimelate desuccinylase n=1 Tax=Staphylococcus auricularis TaxID=29379 RepID=A0AAP8PQ82_9STAP|nr:ArgE/DapE family deacylase [Staphylococcus auricularis]PNZ68433.1 succinyl-diaminopimelate desuccinylase [Staphylococcus auricularis]QPT07142.1 ArgE/DapE family deacylase [Staphylococcus auricularis]BCU51572.1 succinyl-diaminopimelate desuccinylase [Staphylococcus auricularis]SQJ07064.1 succinyl-diaminopimelate desuccinylase [Staphylococcus auricularis]